MRSFEFIEDQLADFASFAQKMFDENDPRSEHYKREIIRPRLRWGLIFLFLLLIPIALSVGLGLLLGDLGVGVLWIALSIVGCNLLYIAIFLKSIVITLVKMYQHFALERVRLKCRLEPSYSQYMILAIEKYGFLRGFAKGIDRLKRCNINGGRYDDP